MVNIIINEVQGKDINDISDFIVEKNTLEKKDSSNIKYLESDLHLFIDKNFKNFQENIDESLKELIKENNELKSEIRELKNTIQNMNKSTNKRLINLNKTQLSSEDLEKLIDGLLDKKGFNNKSSSVKTKKNKGRRRYNDSDLFIPNKHVSKLWSGLTLMGDGSIFNIKHKKYKLPISLNDLLYFIECDTPKMNRGEFNRLKEEYGINAPIMGKIIYNMRKNNFDGVLSEYMHNLNKSKFNITDDGHLKINKLVTDISSDKARDWIKIMINTTNKQAKILELQKSNPEIDAYHIRVVCDSYSNDKLLELLKEEPVKPFIENNPSKREELLRQGGLI